MLIYKEFFFSLCYKCCDPLLDFFFLFLEKYTKTGVVLLLSNEDITHSYTASTSQGYGPKQSGTPRTDVM